MTEQATSTPIHVLALSGRLDASAAPRVRQDVVALLSEKNACVIVNLAAVLYVSSSTLRVLLSAHRSAKRNGGALVLCCLQPQVQRVVTMVGFDQVFKVFDSEDAARQALRAAAQQSSGVAKKL